MSLELIATLTGFALLGALTVAVQRRVRVELSVLGQRVGGLARRSDGQAKKLESVDARTLLILQEQQATRDAAARLLKRGPMGSSPEITGSWKAVAPDPEGGG